MSFEQSRNVACLQKVSPRGRDKRPHLGRSSLELCNQRFAAIDDGNNVLEVVAGDWILPASVVESREFCREKIGTTMRCFRLRTRSQTFATSAYC